MSNINDFGMPFTSQSGDRAYSALDWRSYFSALLEDGVIGDVGNELMVKPQSIPNKTVYVDTGAIFICGAIRVMESITNLSVLENTSGQPRIDSIIARLNLTDRKIEFAVLKGTPASSPMAPSLTRNSACYELALAHITLVNGYTTITAEAISDKRTDNSVCGYFAYKAKPAWYPATQIPMDAWMYTHFKSALTAQQIAEIEANSTLMSTINANTMAESLIGYKTDSYLVFCTNANSESLDAAFGKNNTGIMRDIGLQIAMLAWYKGESSSTYPFTNTKVKRTFSNVLSDQVACYEISVSPSVIALIYASPYAWATYIAAMAANSGAYLKYVLATVAGLEPSNYADLATMINNTSAIGAILDNPTCRNIMYYNGVYMAGVLVAAANAMAAINTRKTTTVLNSTQCDQGRCFCLDMYAGQNGSGNSGQCTAVKVDGSVATAGYNAGVPVVVNAFCKSLSQPDPGSSGINGQWRFLAI